MSLLRRVMAVHPSAPDSWIMRAFGGFASLTGMAITPDGAESVAAVFACCRIIAEGVSQLPLHLYERLDEGGKSRAVTHPLYMLLQWRPNSWQTPFEFWEMMVGHAALRGAGYAQKIYRNDGQVDELLPLHPDRMTFRYDAGNEIVVVDYQPIVGGRRTFLLDDLFRITTHSVDGITGRSPVAIAREAIGLAMATERYGARLFSNYARPGGVLSHPGKLSKEARERLKKSWQEQYAGVENAHSVAVLEEGLSWTAVGMNNRDVQFVEERKFQIQEIARMYRIPPHMLGELERATFSNIEQQALEFVTYTLLPWLKRIQQAVWRDLLTTADQDKGLFCEFLVDELLKGDIASRYSAYATARQWGWLNADEIREMENRNAIPNGGGKAYLQPANMMDVNDTIGTTLPGSTGPKKQKQLPPGKQPPADPRQGDTGDQQAHLAQLLREPLHRVARREAQIVRDAFRRAGAAGILEAAYSGHADFIIRTIGPVVGPAASLYAGGTPPHALLLVKCIEDLAEKYVERARAEWSRHTKLTAGRVDELVKRLEAEMPDRLSRELAAAVTQILDFHQEAA